MRIKPNTIRFLALALCSFGLAAAEGFAAGVTVITHGFQLDCQPPLVRECQTPVWETEMANAIAARIRGGNGGKPPAVYTLHFDLGGDLATVTSALTLDAPSGSKPTASGDIVIKVNWTVYSQLGSSASVVGRELARRLLAGPTDGSFSGTFLQLPIHFIGHSRGTYVNSSAIDSLGRQGIWVDINTTLDGQSEGFDGDLKNWSNIRFADNYFQDCPAGSFSGFSIPGMFERQLADLVGFCAAVVAHQRVHTYFHGTIDLNTSEIDGDPIVRNFWYGTMQGQQPKTGFYFSSAVPDEFAKTGIKSGLAWYFGGSATASS